MCSRGAWQYVAVWTIRPVGKSQSTELWILLASLRVISRSFVASMMKTCTTGTTYVTYATYGTYVTTLQLIYPYPYPYIYPYSYPYPYP